MKKKKRKLTRRPVVLRGDIFQPNAAIQNILSSTFTKGPLESKKWVGMVLGVSCVLAVWAVTVACMIFKTSIAGEFVSLATVVISFVGAMVTTLITGQAVTEFKTAAALTEMNTTSTAQSETVTKEIKPFSQPAQ